RQNHHSGRDTDERREERDGSQPLTHRNTSGHGAQTSAHPRRALLRQPVRFGSKVSVVETAFCAQPRRTLVEQRNDRPMTDHRHPLQTNSPPKASSTPFSRETES